MRSGPVIPLAAVEPGSLGGLARQAGPIEREVGMGMLERLHDFRIEGFAADLDVRRRPK
jgi:hypothetical protein